MNPVSRYIVQYPPHRRYETHTPDEPTYNTLRFQPCILVSSDILAAT